MIPTSKSQHPANEKMPAQQAAAMTETNLPQTPSPKLLDQLTAAARQRGHAEETVTEMAEWCRRFVRFHGKRHPREMGLTEIGQFLQHVAATQKDALRMLETARNGLDFLYRDVLHLQLGELPLPRPPKLLDQVRQMMRVRHYAVRTEECYAQWVERFIRFHRLRHPRDMGEAEIELFLTNLAVKGQVSASTQNQALGAMLFLFREVLGIEVGKLDAVRARRPKRLPIVLAAEEVAAVLALVEGAEGLFSLMARLLYGCGLRLMECCRLRVKDIDLARGHVLAQSSSGIVEPDFV
jgi:Phage integrase, N-terminal SAM-like domain/Phage integrase family